MDTLIILLTIPATIYAAVKYVEISIDHVNQNTQIRFDAMQRDLNDIKRNVTITVWDEPSGKSDRLAEVIDRAEITE